MQIHKVPSPAYNSLTTRPIFNFYVSEYSKKAKTILFQKVKLKIYFVIKKSKKT